MYTNQHKIEISHKSFTSSKYFNITAQQHIRKWHRSFQIELGKAFAEIGKENKQFTK
jgi:hypothetical protein